MEEGAIYILKNEEGAIYIFEWGRHDYDDKLGKSDYPQDTATNCIAEEEQEDQWSHAFSFLL